ncbi:MAG: hypothetical protein LDL19_04555 [Thiobacillus sp.]|nr:hypothetical protein [Thiobacillus sp.]
MPECLIRLWLVLAFAIAPAWAADNLHVIAVHSYNADYAWTRGQHDGFVAALREARPDVTVNVEYLNTKQRQPDPEYLARYADFMRQKYAGVPPDAFYVTDDDALVFALDDLLHTFPGTPIFFSGVNDPDMLERIKGLPVTGVLQNMDVANNLKLIAALRNNHRHVLVVGDGSATFAAMVRDIDQAIRTTPGWEVTYLVSSDLDVLAARLAEQPDTPVLLTTVGGVRDVSGQVMNSSRTLSRLSQATRAPVISMQDVQVVPGVLGGKVTSADAQGREAAGLLIAWSRGTALGDMPPVRSSPNEWLINETELHRSGVVLPDMVVTKARYVYLLPSFFERHRETVLMGIVLMSGALMFGVLFLMIGVGKNVE